MKSDWFTVEEIDEQTSAISEYGHWEETHCYLFVGEKNALLVDAGLGVGDMGAAVRGLTSLPVSVVVTHAHWDHTGGLKWFPRFGVHKNDATWLRNGLPVPAEMIRKNFMRKPLTKPLPPDFDIGQYFPFVGEPDFILEDGDSLDLGGRTLRVIHTPGHSQGSICLFEKETGYLVTGDCLYEGKIDAFYESTDPADLAKSIDRLNALGGVKRLLPGHHRLEIPVSYLKEAKDAFDSIRASNQLRHGTGIHEFEHFIIHL